MNTLIINTANENLEIVLKKQDDIFCKILNSSSHHNETMLPAVDEILKQNNLNIKDVDKVGVVIGPGSFTGIRVGIATIKAFRDALNIEAKGINNLDYLFALASKQNKDCKTVAILGSKNSYFVATLVNGMVYKYERNLTKQELLDVAQGGVIGMFKYDSNLPCFEVELDAKVLLDCFEKSVDHALVPVYYQLSQGESEKIKRATLEIKEAEVQDLIEVCKIEQETNLPNKMNKSDFKSSILNPNHRLFVACLDKKIIGFMVVEMTDELNIENIVVKKEYRNYGIATRLLEYAKEFAESAKIDRLSLEVSKNNITAFLLYKKFGFEIRRVRKSYYLDGSDAFEMVKEV